MSFYRKGAQAPRLLTSNRLGRRIVPHLSILFRCRCSARRPLMRLTVIGSGYVGLVSGVCLAQRGHRVDCLDIRPEVIQKLNHCEPPIYERGLPDLLRQVTREGTFTAGQMDLSGAQERDLILIAVG